MTVKNLDMLTNQKTLVISGLVLEFISILIVSYEVFLHPRKSEEEKTYILMKLERRTNKRLQIERGVQRWVESALFS